MVDRRKYKVNDDFFKVWSHESAYVLGLIASDGCISKDLKRLEFKQSEKDRELLENLVILLESTYPVLSSYSTSLGKKYPTATLTITSPDICSDLNSFGIGPRKSLVLEWITVVPDEYFSSFVRGYLDGDGCVDEYKDKRLNEYTRLRIRFSGTKNFVHGLYDHIYKTLDIIGNISEVKSAKNHYELSYRSTSAEKLGTWIYQDSTQYTRLSRKYQTFVKIVSLTSKKSKHMSLSDAKTLKRAAALGIPKKLLMQPFDKSRGTIENLQKGKSYSILHDEDTYLYLYNAEVVRVIDGDTVVLSVDLGFKVFTEQPCRLAGIDSPEMKTDEGKNAKLYLEELFPKGTQELLDSRKLDKYGRALGNVYYIK